MAGRQAFPSWKPLSWILSRQTLACKRGLVRRCLYTSVVLLQNDAKDSQDVIVGSRNGFPVITIPLPSRRELCEFTLRPLGDTVRDFIDNIKEEDGGIDRVSVYNQEDARVSGSTRLETLLRSDFNLVVNDVCYNVKVPDEGIIPSEYSRELAKAKTMIHQMYTTLNIEEHQIEKEHKLLSKLDDIKYQLEPMEKMKNELDAKAAQRANIFVWGGLGYMALQFGFLARLTWWEYSWDIMEPVTYFVAYGTVIVAYAYFVITRQEYLYPDSRDRYQLLSFYKFSKKRLFDVQKYNHLKDCVAKIEEDLQELRSPYKLHLPPRVIEKISDE